MQTRIVEKPLCVSVQGARIVYVGTPRKEKEQGLNVFRAKGKRVGEMTSLPNQTATCKPRSAMPRPAVLHMARPVVMRLRQERQAPWWLAMAWLATAWLLLLLRLGSPPASARKTVVRPLVARGIAVIPRPLRMPEPRSPTSRDDLPSLLLEKLVAVRATGASPRSLAYP